MTRRPTRWLGMPLGAILLLALATGVAGSQVRNFVTPLSGAEEIPANDSRARGTAIFQLSPDGTELSYRLIASNIENVHMAHIHMGPPDLNSGIVVWLFPSTAVGPGPLGSGRHDGVLATGTITAANLVGALAGQPLSALIEAIDSGNAYVNVHTNDGIEPMNTGPGDLQGGEIRGHLDH
ncbi:MAG: CHRD domain-containing protein [Chloroflexota bacterium]|nr:CHRD domain-containing protein [Chloroflexota bacterium]